MKILSIETSCDETGISIIETKGTRSTSSGQELQKITFEVLGDSLNSQIKIHAPYGGVYPSLAKREHQKNLPILLERTLKKAGLGRGGIDLIAVTSGPGLEPALWTGIVFAKELSKKWNVPLIPVNHMEGHILSVFGKNEGQFKIEKINFPALALLVSGGHTELVLFSNFGKYKIIGETLDDAAGEAFDKVARMLGLPYPGGPEISKLAELQRQGEGLRLRSLGRRDGAGQKKFLAKNFCAEQMQTLFLPRPILYSKNFDFSFSGLKTAVLYLVRDLQKEDPNILENVKIKQMIAKEFEDAVVETLVFKTGKAIEKYNIRTLIVAGGVSANKYLKKEMQKITQKNQKLYFPNIKLSGDNALMIGIAGYFKYIKNNKKTINHSKIKAEGGLRL